MKSLPTKNRTVRRGGERGTPAPVAGGELATMQLELELDTLREELSGLEESRHHYADLYDFAPVGYLSLDRQGCIHSINITGARLMGQRRDAVLGKPLLPLVAPDDRRKFLHHLTQLRRGQKEVSTELQLGIRPPHVPVQLLSIHSDNNKTLTGYRTAIVDLTERRRSEAALRESEERFRLMADSAPVMIWVAGLDMACNYFNQRWLEFTGRRLEQELGVGWADSVHPVDVARCLEIHRNAFEHHRSFQMEYRLRRRDGEYRWVLDHGVPRFRSPGEFLGYIGSCIDITERQEAEAAVRAAEAQLRLVTDIAPVMLSRCSRDLHFQFANRTYAEFFGRSQQEIVGKHIGEVLGEAAYKIKLPQIEKVLAGQLVEFESEFPPAADNPRYIRVAFRPECDARGEVIGWVAAITDITERKQEERQIQVRNLVARELVDATTLREAAPKILRALGELTGWDVAALWLQNSPAGHLECVDFWHGPEATMSEFEADTRQLRLACGSGVIRNVWSTGQLQFMPDLARETGFLRIATARKNGLRSGFCFPIKTGGRVLGAIECYSRRARELQTGFLEMLTAVGEKLGLFIERKLAEEAMRKSEARLRSILETSLDAIITVESDGVISDWNPRAGEIFGWTPQEVVGRKLVDIIIPGRYRTVFERGRRNYLNTGRSRMVENRVESVALHRSGREFPVEVVITPLALENRLSFSVFVRDITARRQAEAVLHRSREELEQIVRDRTQILTQTLEALQASETRFRGFVESAPDAIVIAEERGRIVLVNARAEQLFGYPRKELEGRSMEVLMPNRFRGRYRDQRGRVDAEPGVGTRTSGLELFGLHKDGSEFPVEISLSPLSTPQGTLVCAAIRDITERKKAEVALRESEARLTAIMEHTPALMFLKDTHGRYLHFNRQFGQTFHLDLKQATGKTDADIFPPEQAAPFRVNDAKVIRAGAPVQFEEVAQQEDGLHTSIVTKFPLFNAEGKVYAVGGIVTDITARKRVEEALQEGKAHYLALFKEAREAQQAARRLSTLVLHAQEKERKRISRELHDDVGQVLNAVNMSVTKLRNDVENGCPLEAAQLGEIQQMLQRTMETVHSFARELRPSLLDELGLLPALRSHLKNLSERTGLDVHLRADPAAEKLGAEEKLVLFRVAQESLNNVVKHADASRVELAVRKTSQGIILSISDNGKSFQLNPSGAAPSQRLGMLGMRERVRLVNGRFAIAPRPGKGTKVWVTIPLMAASDLAAARQREARGNGRHA